MTTSSAESADESPRQGANEGASQAGFVEAEVEGRLWRLARPADLESLWDALGEEQFGDR